MKISAALILAVLTATAGCMNSLDEAIPAQKSDTGLLRAVTVNGRIFYYAEPLLPPPAGGYPVIIFFHGGDGYASDWIEVMGLPNAMTVIGLGRRYLVIAPESGVSDKASGSVNDVMKRWDTAVDSKDIPFILDIVAWLPRSGYLVNMRRIFGVGISSGGAMVSRLCQTVPWIFNRVVLVATCNPNYSPYVSSSFTMRGNHPSAAFIHGTDDFMVPIGRMNEYYTALTSPIPFTQILPDCTFVAAGIKIKMKCEVIGGGHTWFGQYNTGIYDWCDSAP